MRQFIDINNFYPEFVKFGKWYIIKSKLSNDYINEIDTNSKLFPYKQYLQSGKDYVSLIPESEQVMMSNHETETITNQKFIDNAKGNVLIFGLGLGLIIFPLLNDEQITKIDIVEIDSDIISYVGDIIKSHDVRNIVRIHKGDSFEYHNELQTTYDTIYFDIWEYVGEKELYEIKDLHKTYTIFLNKNGWMDSWRSEKMKDYGIQ
jgi:spermidine synthase